MAVAYVMTGFSAVDHIRLRQKGLKKGKKPWIVLQNGFELRQKSFHGNGIKIVADVNLIGVFLIKVWYLPKAADGIFRAFSGTEGVKVVTKQVIIGSQQ